jgi:hypothetical protein
VIPIIDYDDDLEYLPSDRATGLATNQRRVRARFETTSRERMAQSRKFVRGRSQRTTRAGIHRRGSAFCCPAE